MAGPSDALTFTVRRRAAELVTPAGPTPRELKQLSDIDIQKGLRFHTPSIYFYRRGSDDDDPAAVIRDAVARALVHYYPLAGRLREQEGSGRLAVDCTGEGVLFVEADADVRLEQFGDAVLPPFPGLEELLFDVPGSSDVLATPLLLLQVTRLACGGFVLAVRVMHVMADGAGVMQFLLAVAELARGAAAPTVQPVWCRELLQARDPPRRPAFAHREYDDVAAPPPPPPSPDGKGATKDDDDMLLHRSFVLRPREVAAVRSHLPPALRERATTFEVLAGCLWKCLTMAVAPDADEVRRMMFVVSVRGHQGGGIVPPGYYGNAFTTPVALSTAGELCANPVSYAVELVREAKREVSMEYILSVADLMAHRRWPGVRYERTSVVSDETKARLVDLDMGWGRPVYAGPAVGSILDVYSYMFPFQTAAGEDAVVLLVCLPGGAAMDKFAEEMGKLLLDCPEPAGMGTHTGVASMLTRPAGKIRSGVPAAETPSAAKIRSAL